MENYLDKIKKLLNKAESAKEIGSVKEAEIFMIKVQELLIKHNLTMQDMNMHELDSEKNGRKARDITETGYDDGISFGKLVSDGRWELPLLSALTNNYMCTYLYNSFTRKATIIGTTDNIQVVKAMYEYMVNVMRRLSREFHVNLVNKIKRDCAVVVRDGEDMDYIVGRVEDTMNDLSYSNGDRVEYKHVCKAKGIKPEDIVDPEVLERLSGGDGKFEVWTVKSPELLHLMPYREVYIRSFLKGIVDGFNYALWSNRREMEKKIDRGSDITALILVNKEDVDKYVKTRHPNVVYGKAKRVDIEPEAYGSGYNKGITLSPNVVNGGSEGKLLK